MTPSRCILGNSLRGRRPKPVGQPRALGTAGSLGWFCKKGSSHPTSRGRAHRRGRASNLSAAGSARRRLGRRPGLRPRDLLLLLFAAGARPSSLRPWLLGPGRRRLRRGRRRRRRLRRRRRPAQSAMSLAAMGDAPGLVGAGSNPRAHGGSRVRADCLGRRGGSQGRTANDPTAARAALHACARTRWTGRSGKEGTHLGLHVPKDPSAVGGGAAIARPPGNVAPALEWRQGEV